MSSVAQATRCFCQFSSDCRRQRQTEHNTQGFLVKTFVKGMIMTLSLGLTKDRAVRALPDSWFFLFASITKKPWFSTLLGISNLPENIFHFSLELKYLKLTQKHTRWRSSGSIPKYIFPKETSTKHFCFMKSKPNMLSAPVSPTIAPKVNTWSPTAI